VKAQTIEGLEPGPEDLERAFSDLLIDKRIFRKLGPAINSGRGLFLFGPPGNGKTSIAERITEAFGKHVWIPRALEVEGEIIRLFDPINHVEAPLDEGISLMQDVKFDKRWVRIKRPTIVVGGELTMENLEVTYNPTTGISEAPVQLKSNCGTLVIDDFGRQRMAIDELLNRWIVPLEKRYDFLNLASGKKVRVPFDQLVVFSTNLEPKDLVDEAFLRRIPYKIEALNPPEEAFRKLFTIMAPIVGVEYNEEALDHLIKEYYLAVDRPFRNCQPRDLLLQIKNLARFERTEAVMTKDAIDFAVDNYFSVM
ncbi:MAG TPA: AAA family ATPase, partial [Pirellulales bacterium]|nr:AAA family ATPase [Pirellulales bacterium]